MFRRDSLHRSPATIRRDLTDPGPKVAIVIQFVKLPEADEEHFLGDVVYVLGPHTQRMDERTQPRVLALNLLDEPFSGVVGWHSHSLRNHESRHRVAQAGSRFVRDSLGLETSTATAAQQRSWLLGTIKSSFDGLLVPLRNLRDRFANTIGRGAREHENRDDSRIDLSKDVRDAVNRQYR